MINLGIDWSRNFIDACFLFEERILSEKRFDVNASGMNSLLLEIRKWEKEYGSVTAGIETDKHILCSFLVRHSINVSVVDPFSLSRFKEIYSASGRKDDRHDAFSIALMMQKNGGKITPIHKPSAECEQLRLLLRIRERIVRQRTRSIAIMRSVLNLYFPAFSGCFRTISNSAMQMLKLLPDPQNILHMSEEDFLEAVRAIKYFPLLRKKRIFGYFQKHIPDFLVDHTEIHTLEIRMILDQMEILNNNLADLNHKIQELYADLPVQKIISSLPACHDSNSLGPMMAAELGEDREKFKNHRAFQSFVGTSPVTRRSGKLAHMVVMRQSCKKSLRNAMYLHAFCSLRREPWAREYYDALKKRGKSHSAALRALSNKWAKIIFAMWKYSTPYDRSLFLRQIA